MSLKIAACQIEVKPGHPDKNFQKVRSHIEKAKSCGDDIVIFSEMVIPGYIIGDEWENEAFVRDCHSYNDLIIEASENITVIWGNVDIDTDKAGEDGRIRKFNSAFVAQNGELIGKFAKTLHPDYREFDDDRHFYSSRKLAQDNHLKPQEYLQPLKVEINGETRMLGITLCEDMWSNDYSINPVEILAENGAETIINISCSPWTWRKNDKRHRVVREHLKNHPVSFIYVNNTGIQNNGKTIFLFDGKTTIYNKDGSLRKVTEKFEEQTLRTDLDSETKETQSVPALSSQRDLEEIHQGLIYGIQKFFGQIGQQNAVIGMSGGVDSSLSAWLLTQALGSDHVYAVNMPTEFNSETTKGLARKLAERLNVNYAVVPVQEAYEYTVNQLSDIRFSKPGNNDEESFQSLTLNTMDKENIQARDRGGRILAGIASSLDAVFINNGNKSETATGYATLYGDINGALAPIADLFKTQVYDLCRYINSAEDNPVFEEELFEIPASAELSEEQNIEDGDGDPFHYPYHDKLLLAFIEDRLDPEDILYQYSNENLEHYLDLEPGIVAELFEDAASFIEDLERTWRLFKISYFKRIQTPPIICVSKRAFGFDLRESQLGVHFTRRYSALKQRLLD